MGKSKLTFLPATKERWKDVEILFGERGACGGCWCMSWRLSRKDFDMNKGEGNRKRLKKLISSNAEPGIIAYHNNEPAAWIAFAPREEYIRLENSRVLQPIDEKPVLAVSCFFVRKDFRRTGLSVLLLKEVIKTAKKRGIKIVEGYPVTPYSDNIPAAFAWTGLPASFEKAGFRIAATSGKRIIVRYYL